VRAAKGRGSASLRKLKTVVWRRLGSSKCYLTVSEHMSRYRVVQPWGPDKGRQATVLSEHADTTAAFAEIDRLAAQMARTGARPETVELLVADADGHIVPRPETH
jgi:hypothetical protein